MCIGNRAEVSSLFINGQLRALYENAVICAKKHLDGLKPSESAVEYATCLAEFYGPGRHVRHEPSRQDLAFFATFDRPRIEFVCNHEVVLFLTLNDGHYNLDTTKFAPKRQTSELHESIQNCTIAFRITFSSHSTEKFHCKAIGNADHYTSVLRVLDMDSATFVPAHSSIPGFSDNQDERSFYTRDRKVLALTYYLTKFYLPTIKRAGHHVLYSLPDFGNLTNTTAYTNYSMISTGALATDTLFGIRVEDVNMYLRRLWLQATASLDEYGHSIDHVSRTFLAELRLSPVDDVDDMHMHLSFGPLYVQPLCKREVILYLDVQDIHAHFGGFSDQPREQLRGWKIAFIVDIIFEETEGVKRIKLDLQTARFCEHLSVFGEHHDVEILLRIKTTLIRQITTYYLSILQTSEVITIFYYNRNIHGGGYGDTGGDRDIINVDGCYCQDEGSCVHTGIRWGVIQKRTLTQTHTSEYDLVTALTQGSINLHFNKLWQSARRRLTLDSTGKVVRTWESTELELETCLVDYSFVHPEHNDEVFFAASFEAPKVQLVCKEGSPKVIFYLHLSKGYLKMLGSGKSLQSGSDDSPFSNWHLAFEVDLKIIDSGEDTTHSAILKRLGLSKPTGLKQLVLDLSTARLNLRLSTIPGLLDGTDYRAIRARREALVYYIQTCYFPVLKRALHHVLYTLPQGVPGAHNHSLMLTSLQFEIVPFKYMAGVQHCEGIFGPYKAIFNRNAIVIMGMTCGRSFPHCSLPRSVNWVCGYGKEEVPLGMAYLSRKSFLDDILLTKLESINRETTIVPTFSGIKDSKWALELEAWDRHNMKEGQKCEWRERSKDNVDILEFEWKNKELWRYEHDSDLYTSGAYTVDCITHNVLSIPTSRVEKSGIQLEGAVKLNLKYEGTGKDWNSEMSIHWSANISFTSSALGLQVQLHPARIIPDIRSTRVTQGAPGHEIQKLALEQLRHKFPDSVDFTILLRELKEDLEGTWAGVQVHAHEFCVAHPVFNRHGDLLLELMVRGSNFNNNLDGRGCGYSTLINKRSVMNLNVGVTPVDMDGNGNATSEHRIFLKPFLTSQSVSSAVHKAGDVLQSYSPSISRMTSPTAQITSHEHGNSQPAIEEGEL